MDNKKRILVTGASGFIGNPCVKLLIQQGYEVHAVSSQKWKDTKDIIWHRLDLMDTTAVISLCEQVHATHLLHLAWHVKPGYSSSIENIRWITASMNLITEFHKQGGQRALIAGTCYEYDSNGGILEENCSPKGPHTVYGASKHTLQEWVRHYVEQSGLSCVWARVFYLYGPRESPRRLLPSVINALLKGERVSCSEGIQVQDYLHVNDVASALVVVMESAATGAVNIGSGIPISVRELVTKAAALLSSVDRVDFGTRPMPANEPMVIVANTERLNKEIGWEPEFTLETGLTNTIEWWRTTLSKQKDAKS